MKLNLFFLWQNYYTIMSELFQRNFQSLFVSRSTALENETPYKEDISGVAHEELLFSQVAQPVTLPEHLRKSILSPTYSPQIKVSYIEQCFDDVKYLAEGSFGVVFEARSKDDGKLYAVKRFKKPFTNRKQRSIRLGEIHRYASIPQSRFCVELIRAWEENAFLFVQMELCSVALKQYVLRVGLSEELLWKILLDLLLAVKHLHTNQLIHLDIKPDNILVSSDNTFKLADFGLMLDVSKGPIKDAEEGDARYLAPEVLRGMFTQAADIFSLGISLLEVGSSMQLPGHGPLWQELRRGILPYCRLACSSKEFFYLICEMMSPLPDDRPSASKLLKYNRLSKMYHKRRLHAFFTDVTSTMKSICKCMAMHCGIKFLKPLVSRMCPTSWKRKAALNQPDLRRIGHRCQDPPPLTRPITTRTKEEERLFHLRLSACKKRLTFDDENTILSPVTSSVGNAEIDDSENQSSPKRRWRKNAIIVDRDMLFYARGARAKKKNAIEQKRQETELERVSMRDQKNSLASEFITLNKETSGATNGSYFLVLVCFLISLVWISLILYPAAL